MDTTCELADRSCEWKRHRGSCNPVVAQATQRGVNDSKFSMQILLWGLIPPPNPLFFSRSSPLWYTMSSRVQLNQRGKELLLQQLTLSGEVASSELYGSSTAWGGRGRCSKAEEGGREGCTLCRGKELFFFFYHCTLLLFQVFFFPSLCETWKPLSFLVLLSCTLLPLSSCSPWSSRPLGYFIPPTLHSLSWSTFSLPPHHTLLMRWIRPTLSSFSLWCDTAWQCRARESSWAMRFYCVAQSSSYFPSASSSPWPTYLGAPPPPYISFSNTYLSSFLITSLLQSFFHLSVTLLSSLDGP